MKQKELIPLDKINRMISIKKTELVITGSLASHILEVPNMAPSYGTRN